MKRDTPKRSMIWGGLCLLLWGLLPGTAAAEQLMTVHVGYGDKAVSPYMATMIVAKYLHYDQENGFNADVLPVGSNAAVLSGIATGRLQVGSGIPAFLIAIAAKGDSLPCVSYFQTNYPPRWILGVKPDSAVHSYTDLKGDRVGVTNFGVQGYSVAQELFQRAGVDPQKDISWLSVGEGVSAGLALDRGAVSALVYDGMGFGQIEAAGIKVRMIPQPANSPAIGGVFRCSSQEFIKDHRKIAIGIGQAELKAEVFITENPEAAAYIFAKTFPEAVPQGKSLKEQIAAVLLPVNALIHNFYPPKGSGVAMGAVWEKEWQDEIEFRHLQDKLKDPSIFYTTSLTNEIRNFDVEKVKEQARNFKVPVEN